MKKLLILFTLLFSTSLLANDAVVSRFNNDVERLRSIATKANTIGKAITAELTKQNPNHQKISRSAANLLIEMTKYDQLRADLQKRRTPTRTRAQNLKLKISGVPQGLSLPPAARSIADYLKSQGSIDQRGILRAQDRLPKRRGRIPRMPRYEGPGGSSL